MAATPASCRFPLVTKTGAPLAVKAALLAGAARRLPPLAVKAARRLPVPRKAAGAARRLPVPRKPAGAAPRLPVPSKTGSKLAPPAAKERIPRLVEAHAKQAIQVADQMKIPRRLKEPHAALLAVLAGQLKLGPVKDDLVVVLRLLHAVHALAKMFLSLVAASPTAPLFTPPPPAPNRKIPKVFFSDGTTMTFNFGPGDEDSMVAAMEEALSHLKASVVFVAVASVM